MYVWDLDTVRQRSYPRKWRSKSGVRSTYHTWRASSDEKENKENDIGTVRFLANDHSGASDVDTDIVRTMDHVMIISTIFGFILTVVGVNETAVAGYKIITTAGNIQEKKEQERLKASIHEEAQQILKDIIREAGE
jgi:hypothetical protein